MTKLSLRQSLPLIVILAVLAALALPLTAEARPGTGSCAGMNRLRVACALP